MVCVLNKYLEININFLRANGFDSLNLTSVIVLWSREGKITVRSYGKKVPYKRKLRKLKKGYTKYKYKYIWGYVHFPWHSLSISWIFMARIRSDQAQIMVLSLCVLEYYDPEANVDLIRRHWIPTNVGITQANILVSTSSTPAYAGASFWRRNAPLPMHFDTPTVSADRLAPFIMMKRNSLKGDFVETFGGSGRLWAKGVLHMSDHIIFP